MVELPVNRIAAAPLDVADGISNAATSEFEPNAEAAGQLPVIASFERVLPDCRWGLSDPPHDNWQAVGHELQFVRFAVPIDRATGDTGNLSRREVSDLPA